MMEVSADRVMSLLDRLDALLLNLDSHTVLQFRSDAGAARFHLATDPSRLPVIVVIGGTGTGKSTLVNRLLAAQLSATSFRRTFTAGPVAIVHQADQLPSEWPGLVRENSLSPARGQNDRLMLLTFDSPITRQATLVDTPDLDGDSPAHHTLADRAFRWADALIFLVSPEKYQMTELPPYYRLAERYEVPALYVMNKAESDQQVDDYRKLLPAGAKLFAIPRDDAGWQPSEEMALPALRQAVLELKTAASDSGRSNRCRDLAGRLMDQIIGPMQTRRKQIDRARTALLAMDAPISQVDVHPITEQLQQRMRERSVLYLLGPQRVLDRVRQAPAILARLPRTAWDLVMRGQLPKSLDPTGIDKLSPGDGNGKIPAPPDFRTIAVDQFNVLRSRIDDAIRSANVEVSVLQSPDYARALLDPNDAGKIVEEELAELTQWLEQRWNATPRDTAMLEKMLKYLPGGRQLTKLSEAAPYLLTIAVATHHAFFGHIDLMILGGWSLMTWLTEKVSNEVSARARQTNDRIAQRFEELAVRQIEQVEKWLNGCAPGNDTLQQLQRLADELHGLAEDTT